MHPTIEIEATPDGYAAIVFDAAGEHVLWITDSYLTRRDAEHAARVWIDAVSERRFTIATSTTLQSPHTCDNYTVIHW